MAPIFSVIIPTFNRLDILTETLRALEAQQDAPPFEVIVVDDGSTDGTGAWLDNLEVGYPFHRLRQENQGPGAARNAGIRLAKGHFIAFLGDDTVPAPGWLGVHHQAHLSRGSQPRLAVIGYTAWHPAVQVTPFLRYLNEQGLQFGFALIKDPENVPFNFCYSSNLSVPRQWLPADPFDEAFPYAAWEDVELGYRLSRQGLQLVYASDAIVRHRHLVRFEAFAQRQEKAGRSAVIFYRKHLELGAFLGVSESGPPDLPPVWYRRILYRMACLCEYGPERFAPLWKGVLRHHYLKGLHEGWSDV